MMKKHRPIRLFIPSSMLNVIESSGKRKKENYVYIIDYLLFIPTRDRRYDNYDNYLSLKKGKLKSLFGCDTRIYIDFLLKNELIECDNIYIEKKKEFYYRINEKHKFDCNYFELQPDTPLFKNRIREINKDRTNYSRLEPYLNEMRLKFMDLQFDYQGALKLLETVTDERKKASYAMSLNHLQDHRFRYFKRNKTNNRLDTNLTNLKKEFRQFIVGDYVNIDLRNSQPFLLSVLLEKIALILSYFIQNKLEFNQTNIDNTLNNTPPISSSLPLCCKYDLQKLVDCFGIQPFKTMLLIRKNRILHFITNLSMYKDWVSKGMLYDEFVKRFDCNYTREQMKNIILEVLYSNNTSTNNFRTFIPYEKEKQVFSRVFPFIHEMIVALKQKDNKRLSVYLQKMESEVFIDKVAKNLVEVGIVPLTIHDSIIVLAQQQEKALAIVKSVFLKETGIEPTFHVEPLRK